MKLIFSALSVLMFLGAYAQPKAGLSIGLSANNVSFDYAESNLEPDSKFKLGGHIGLQVEFDIDEALGFQTGLLFTNKGFSIDDPFLEDDDFVRYNLNYLEVPLKLTAKLSDNVSAFAGPYVAFGLGGSIQTFIRGESDEQNIVSQFGALDRNDIEDLDENDTVVNGLDFGLNFGVGFRPSDESLISLGYSVGFGNITPEIDVEGVDFFASDFKESNRVISLSLTRFFN